MSSPHHHSGDAADARSLSISWTALRAHAECKQKAYRLRRGHRSPVGDLRSYFHGMVVDRVMQAWLHDEARSPHTMAAMVDDMITQAAADAVTDGDGVVRWRHLDDRAQLREFCVELVTRLEPILDRLVLPYRFEGPTRFKVALKVPYLDGTPVRIHLAGEMDLLVHRDDGRVIWDLKGTRDDQYWRKVLGQLVFYDVANLIATGERPALVGLIQPMCPEPVLEWNLTDDHRRAMQARILNMCTDIWNEDRACKEGTSGCTWCVVRHACDRYNQPATAANTISLAGALRAAARPAPGTGAAA